MLAVRRAVNQGRSFLRVNPLMMRMSYKNAHFGIRWMSTLPGPGRVDLLTIGGGISDLPIDLKLAPFLIIVLSLGYVRMSNNFERLKGSLLREFDMADSLRIKMRSFSLRVGQLAEKDETVEIDTKMMRGLDSEVKLVCSDETILKELGAIRDSMLYHLFFHAQEAGEVIVRTQIKRHELRSYEQICKSLYWSELQISTYANECMLKAMRLYAEKVGIVADPEMGLLMEGLNKILVTGVSLPGLRVYLESFAGLYVKEHREWYADILSSLGYTCYQDMFHGNVVVNAPVVSAFFLLLSTSVDPENKCASGNLSFLLSKGFEPSVLEQLRDLTNEFKRLAKIASAHPDLGVSFLREGSGSSKSVFFRELNQGHTK